MGISARDFHNALLSRGVRTFAGVPDSLLKPFCAYLADHAPRSANLITANEGTAVAHAIGHHLATGEVTCVYLQNSGLGNFVNPLLSLADRRVYNIPLLFLIGWRGEPGRKDEPQHIAQGAVTEQLLQTLDLPHSVLPHEIQAAEQVLDTAMNSMHSKGGQYALLVSANCFDTYHMLTAEEMPAGLILEATRESALKIILDQLAPNDAVVSTTGMASREVFELREQQGEDHSRDFLTVGGMGHCSSIALGIAMAKSSKRVICIDGDGAVIMHMGAMHTIGSRGPPNFYQIVLNNGAHDSVGGQPTGALSMDLPGVAIALGYKLACRVTTEAGIGPAVQKLLASAGPALLEVLVLKGARSNLGRPNTSPKDNKLAFMEMLSK
eukprot:CAMPEP_0114225412 /NCGR_PEP_ID=MMETSP0058-20121206/651_1 /TAXON_ID=36894 /ORGANISM="Pyramimonas parkeae, CCMP726" /LENGTH=380 /DNA_ID=CAMNT_0001336001 /DNA_START=142 /DNA_END=1284 /DNA_ORIENTATION=+